MRVVFVSTPCRTGTSQADAKAKKYYVDMMKEMAATKGLPIGTQGFRSGAWSKRAEHGKDTGGEKDNQVGCGITVAADGEGWLVSFSAAVSLYWDGSAGREDVKKFVEFYKSRIEAYQ